MKTRFFVCLLVLLSAANLAFADLYHFTSESTGYGCQIQSYVDGIATEAWNGSVGSFWDPSHHVPANGDSLWDVDVQAMTTTFLGMHTELDETITLSDNVTYQMGFGNQLEIPFTLYLTTYSSDINVVRGPFPIAQDLTFEMVSGPIRAQDISIEVAGSITFNDQQRNFNLTTNPEGVAWGDDASEFLGKFDDSLYPEWLGLRLNLSKRFVWSGQQYYKAVEGIVDGHLVEFYINPHVAEFNIWSGQPTDIPEPATVVLLVTGLIVGGFLLCRK